MWSHHIIACAVFRFGLVCYIYFTFYFLILPSICKLWPYSKYFNFEINDKELVRQLITENDERINFAEKYLRGDISQASDVSNGKQFDIVIVVITLNRESKSTGRLRFLTQTMAHLMMLKKKDKSKLFEKKHIMICNVDEEGDDFSEAASLSNIVQVVSQFANASETDDEEFIDVFEKEKVDYIFCLQLAKQYKPQYVMMIEDDVILEAESLETVEHLVNLRLNHADHNRMESEPWIFVKLYYPEKWQGYGNEQDKIGELVGIATLGGTLFVIVTFVLFWLVRFRGLTVMHFLVMFWLGAATSALTAYLVGRQYVQAWRRWSPYTHRLITAPGCCTQAVIYHSSIVDGLAQYLSDIRCNADFSVDLVIDEFAETRGLKGYLVEPNVCRHIGFISSVRRSAKAAAEFL